LLDGLASRCWRVCAALFTDTTGEQSFISSTATTPTGGPRRSRTPIEYDNTTTGGSYAKGHLTKIADPSGNTTYIYDSLGRITSKTQTVTASPSNKTFTIGYSYSNGRQTGITYPSGRAITYTFDAKGDVASIKVDGTTTILSAVTYFPFGGASGWAWGNGEPMQRYFDLDGRVSALTLGPASGTYADLSQTFGYDSMNRLNSATLSPTVAQSYTYDANGNRTNLTINTSSTNFNYPSSSHRLSSLSGATSKSFTYDNAGNTTASGSLTLVYDGRGRMKQAGTATYLVNGLGQRVRKNTGSDTYFAYDEAGHLIGEYDSSGIPIEETVWLGDLPAAIVKPNGGSFSAFYVWTDNLGTPRQVTDTGSVSRWEWANGDPFGSVAPNENPAGVGTFNYNLRFPGQYTDAETGFSYNYLRDYDPTVGRYVESDSIGLKGGFNTFAYVRGRPLNLIDRRGDTAALAAAPLIGEVGLGGAGVALGTLGALGAAGAIGVGIGSGANWAIGAALGTSIGSAIYDACHKDDCKQRLKECLESGWGGKVGFDSACFSCFQRCQGTGTWPDSVTSGVSGQFPVSCEYWLKRR